MKGHKISHRSPKTSRTLAKKPAAAPGKLVRLRKKPTTVVKTVGSSSAPVALKLSAPSAKEVFVAGSFNGWRVGATPLSPTASGDWQSELKLTPGRYEYLFVVDGTWQPDPAAPETAPNPFGGRNSVLSVN